MVTIGTTLTTTCSKGERTTLCRIAESPRIKKVLQ